MNRPEKGRQKMRLEKIANRRGQGLPGRDDW